MTLLLLCGCLPLQESAAKREEARMETDPQAEQWCFHYEQLDASLRPAYASLYAGLEEMNSEIELGKIDGQTLETAFVAVMKDNPALFHVQNDYTYEEYSDGSITMKPQYYFDAQEKADIQRQIDERTQGDPQRSAIRHRRGGMVSVYICGRACGI
ncbi:MAG: hypothetical protein V8T10_00815 [Merdibacter sp.]